jgi:hypothetical protein
VEILYTYSTYNESINTLAFLSIALLLGSICFCLVYLTYKEWCKSLLSLVIAVASFFVLYGAIEWYYSTEIKHHEVIIADYNQVDFSKYQLEEQKGKIIILKEIK